MKKLWISILAVLMLVRAEPAQALSWIDFCNYAMNFTTTLFTSQNAPKLVGGALIVYGLGAVLLSLKKDNKADMGDQSKQRVAHAKD